METLQAAAEHICHLKGSQIALETLLFSIIRALPGEAIAPVKAEFDRSCEIGKTVMLNAVVSEYTLQGFEEGVQRALTTIQDRM